MKRKKKLEVVTEDATKQRLHILLGDIVKQYEALKILVVEMSKFLLIFIPQYSCHS